MWSDTDAPEYILGELLYSFSMSVSIKWEVGFCKTVCISRIDILLRNLHQTVCKLLKRMPLSLIQKVLQKAISRFIVTDMEKIGQFTPICALECQYISTFLLFYVGIPFLHE